MAEKTGSRDFRLWPSWWELYRVTPRWNRADEGFNMVKVSTRLDVPVRNGRWKTIWKVGKWGSIREYNITMRCREQTNVCWVFARSLGKFLMDLIFGELDLDLDWSWSSIIWKWRRRLMELVSFQYRECVRATLNDTTSKTAWNISIV